MSQSERRALVIGASSGIGAAVAVELSSQGHQVALVARRGDLLESVVRDCNAASGHDWAKAYVHDVTDYEATPSLFQTITTDLGGLDCVVYASAVMPRVERDEYNFEKDRAILEVGLLGAVAWLNEAAACFTEKGAGVICGISSIAGDRGRRPSPVYCTSKAGLDTYLEALRNRLAPHGAHVVTIKPGYVATAMTEGMEGLFWVITPAKAARIIVSAIRRRRRKVYVPARWGLVGLVIRCIPSFIFRRLDF